MTFNWRGPLKYYRTLTLSMPRTRLFHLKGSQRRMFRIICAWSSGKITVTSLLQYRARQNTNLWTPDFPLGINNMKMLFVFLIEILPFTCYTQKFYGMSEYGGDIEPRALITRSASQKGYQRFSALLLDIISVLFKVLLVLFYKPKTGFVTTPKYHVEFYTNYPLYSLVLIRNKSNRFQRIELLAGVFFVVISYDFYTSKIIELKLELFVYMNIYKDTRYMPSRKFGSLHIVRNCLHQRRKGHSTKNNCQIHQRNVCASLQRVFDSIHYAWLLWSICEIVFSEKWICSFRCRYIFWALGRTTHTSDSNCWFSSCCHFVCIPRKRIGIDNDCCPISFCILPYAGSRFSLNFIVSVRVNRNAIETILMSITGRL